MKRYTAIIVDDENQAAEGLYLLLQNRHEIEIKSVLNNGQDAILALDKIKPDIVLLDIQMPEITGFDVLRSVNFRPPVVIFVTAYDEYALKAFEVHAMDYILKPFKDSRFHNAIDRAIYLLNSQKVNSEDDKIESLLDDQLSKLNENSKNGIYPDNSRLAIKTDGKIHFLNYEDVSRIEGYDYYVKIYINNKYFTVRTTLKKLDSGLPNIFLRVHRSSIVNVRHINSVENRPNREYLLRLKDNTEVKVSRSFSKSFEKHLPSI